jgi:membrane associated rhomboid family serine protease
MFMHANVLHIAGNMLYFWIFGNNIEDALGHVKFVFFYLACGFAAAIAQVFMAPNSSAAMVGASGAIAGVLGAYLILFPKARVLTLVFIVFFIQVVAIPAYFILGYWILLQLLNGLMSPSTQGGVAYMAHIGGFSAGIVLILLFGGRRLLTVRRQPDYGQGWRT